LRLRRKDKKKALTEKGLREIIEKELNAYIKREDLQEYLDNIERDKRKKKLWDSLSPRKKIRLMRYALEKKGEKHDKK
jgi:hypothetical protein